MAVQSVQASSARLLLHLNSDTTAQREPSICQNNSQCHHSHAAVFRLLVTRVTHVSDGSLRLWLRVGRWSDAGAGATVTGEKTAAQDGSSGAAPQKTTAERRKSRD
ncbi:unnamed protein product [Pleuronectes platessa]|uniref:Uncharacterized protein n=1 Tax=Pleuronectes platessa TaxID=8262 RepID=A0A9N7YDI5_PLEPL|nr:unnamed protein product [Pleuronectes platessa]